MRLLLARTDLVGKPVAAVLTKDGRQMEYIKFDVPAGEPNGMKGANDAIRTD